MTAASIGALQLEPRPIGALGAPAAASSGAMATDLTATSTLTGTLTADGSMAAALAATSTLTANLTSGATMAADLTASASLTGTLTSDGALAASMSASASLTGTLVTDGGILLDVSATLDLVATLTAHAALGIAMGATASLTATLSAPTTIQVSTAGPGVEDWRSSKFAVTVNGGAAAYVYGFAREAQFSCIAWDSGATVEQSWFGFGANETATVAITLADATPITSAVVYPKDAGVVQVIAAGVLTLTVPTNVRLRVEVNGDRAEVLSLFSSPLSTAPSFKTDAADLGQTVTNVSVDDPYLTVPSHGWGSTGTIFRGFLQSTGTLPTTSAGTLTEHEAVTVYIVDADTVQLIDSAETLIVFSSEGTGTITLSQAYWTTGTLFFGAGVHKIGRGFEVGSGSTIYLDRDAVVIGSFHLTEPNTGSAASSTLVEITGPGVIAGTYAEPSLVYALPSYVEKRHYAAIYVINETVPMDNVVSEVTVVAQPFYVNVKGVREFRHVKCISPWTYTTDGFSTHTDLSADGLVGRCQSCYALVGDDAIKIRNRYRSQEFIDTFVTATNNGCIQHFSIPTSEDSGLTASMTNCHAMTLAGPDVEGGGSGNVGSKMVWKALTDGYSNQSTQGHFNFNIDSLKIWGPIECRMFLLGNIANPFPGTYPVRDLYGQVASMVLSNVWCEETPGQLSLISSKDATNTPHDIWLNNLTVAGTLVTRENYTTYLDVDPEVYNLRFNGETGIEVAFSSSMTLEGYLTRVTSTLAAPVVAPVISTKVFMKQRIHNALRAAIGAGNFYKCVVNSRTGEMTIDPARTINPTGVIIKELKTGFSLAEHYRRGMNSSEISNWTWVAVVSFNCEVSCEEFEESLIASGIQIPPIAGAEGQRTLLARLSDSIYDHPPEQSPANGTVVEFTFEVLSPLLRR